MLDLTATATPPDGTPDAELLRLCAEFHRLQAAVNAASGGAALDAAMNARWTITDRIKALVPATAAGHRAKAAVAIVLLREGSVGDDGDAADSDVSFAFVVLTDLARSGAAPAL